MSRLLELAALSILHRELRRGPTQAIRASSIQIPDLQGIFMVKGEVAFVSFYDSDTGQVRFCIVPRSRVQAAIDNALVMNIPPSAPDDSREPFTDEDARKLGGMVLLCHGKQHPELRERLQFVGAESVSWTSADRPEP
ncbi:hypothetical protein [Caballeronia novacaledonica]|uniref:hypothetical protein n=1 Tax=Caballeronia novacaledonica TaxID=1544861 RepID=UPI001EE17419|nr:hypothetical protein [Caballeronia novacaledonica]